MKEHFINCVLWLPESKIWTELLQPRGIMIVLTKIPNNLKYLTDVTTVKSFVHFCLFFYCLFLYISSLEIQLSRMKSRDPSNRFNPRHMFRSVPSQNLDFQRYNSWCFRVHELKREMVVRFDDIRGIVNWPLPLFKLYFSLDHSSSICCFWFPLWYLKTFFS